MEQPGPAMKKQKAGSVPAVPPPSEAIAALCFALPPLPDAMTTLERAQHNIEVYTRKPHEPEPQLVAPSAVLTQASVLLALPPAPDGVPVWLEVQRFTKPPVMAEVAVANARIAPHALSGAQRDMYDTLMAALAPAQVAVQQFYEQYTTSLGIHRAPGDADYYITAVPLRQALFDSNSSPPLVTGDTVLSRLLQSPRSQLKALAAPSQQPHSMEIVRCYSPAFAPTASAAPQTAAAETASKAWIAKQDADQHLAVLLQNSAPTDVAPLLAIRGTDFSSLTEFLPETLSFAGGNLHVHTGPHGDKRAAITVETRKLLLGLASLCDHVSAAFHAGGTIHGDLMPSNVLLRHHGFVAIDPMATPFGAVAPGGTTEWAAPEQIFREPVSDKSDVYSIALMAVAVLGGLLHGTILDRAVALRYNSRDSFKLESVRIITHPEIVFNFSVAPELSCVLRNALQLESDVRPSMPQLRDALVAFAQQPAALPAAWAVRILPKGFGSPDPKLYEHAPGQFHWKVTDVQSTLRGYGQYGFNQPAYEPSYQPTSPNHQYQPLSI